MPTRAVEKKKEQKPEQKLERNLEQSMVQNTVHIPAVDQNMSIAMVNIPVVVIRLVTRVRGAAAQQHHIVHGATVHAVIMAVAAVMVHVQILAVAVIMVLVATLVHVAIMVRAAHPVLHAHVQ